MVIRYVNGLMECFWMKRIANLNFLFFSSLDRRSCMDGEYLQKLVNCIANCTLHKLNISV